MTHRPTLALIASIARNGAIGRNNQLLWHESADQKYFRAVTMGHPVIMGRRTWESLPARFRPLPGRLNIVVTRDGAWQAEGAQRAGSLDDALARAGDASKVFVIGGAQLYAQALPRADELVLTEIEADFNDADTYFPPWDREAFERTAASEEQHTAQGIAYRFTTYLRKKRS